MAAIFAFAITQLILRTPLPSESECVVSEIAWLQQSSGTTKRKS
jgi:hypothetical protein